MRDLGFSQSRIASERLARFGWTEAWKIGPEILRIEKSMPEGTRRELDHGYPANLAAISLAHAHLGDLKGAQTLVAQCDVDSDDCLIARGRIAELCGPAWPSRLLVRGIEMPSLRFPSPMRDGAARSWRAASPMRRSKVQLSNQKGRAHADALEGWGETLMAKNQSHLALAKFAEADESPPTGAGSPEMGRGPALFRQARQSPRAVCRAATLDLTPSEKSELARAT